LKNSGRQITCALAITDYYMFVHSPQLLDQIRHNSVFSNVYTLESEYRAWQATRGPDPHPLDSLLNSWEASTVLSRNLIELERTNQLVFGWEREFFYLPLSPAWQKKILSDSIVWSEQILSKVNPDIIVAIERNTLCNSIFFELAMNRQIDHLTFLKSRVLDRWIPDENFGMGRAHPLHSPRILQKRFCDVRSCPEHFHQSFDFEPSHAIYTASAQSFQDAIDKPLRERLSQVFSSSPGPEVTSIRHLIRKMVFRAIHRKNFYAFPIQRVEQNLFRLSLWELKQAILFAIRLLGFRFWGLNSPPDSRYLLWALHSRPEDSTSVLGFGRDELQLIDSVARQLPAGIKLLVKEHPIMFGTRHRSFYKQIKKMSGVILVDSFANTKQFLTSDFCVNNDAK